MNEVEEALNKLGYDLKTENAKYWRSRPIYRESGNSTSLRIEKDTGSFQDFSANLFGDFRELVKLTLNLGSRKAAGKWIDENNINLPLIERKPKIKVKKAIKDFEFANLLPHYVFYTGEKRGISPEVFEGLECGVCMSGRMGNRLTFVIRDEDGDAIGMAGRDLLGYRDNKWKLIGRKSEWIYPYFSLNPNNSAEEIFLVESIGDMLALKNAGINNILVLFGVSISAKQLNHIVSLGCKVTISTNNDQKENVNVGEVAALSIKEKLSQFINEDNIRIKLPTLNDWGETSKEEIKRILL
jgi:hypothetical protein